MGGQTTYAGFYYFYGSDIDKAKELLSSFVYGVSNPSIFAQEGDGYVWRQDGGEDVIYFQHIIDNYYYYEQIY
jgi:hypothetical protein